MKTKTFSFRHDLFYLKIFHVSFFFFHLTSLYYFFSLFSCICKWDFSLFFFYSFFIAFSFVLKLQHFLASRTWILRNNINIWLIFISEMKDSTTKVLQALTLFCVAVVGLFLNVIVILVFYKRPALRSSSNRWDALLTQIIKAIV